MNKYFYPIYKSNLKPWIKYWLIKRLSGEGESELKVVTISSGKLFKVDKTKPLSVKEYYGNTIQDGTPTPETPIEVQTISGDNEIFIGSNTYKLDLASKNLFNGAGVAAGNTTNWTVTFSDNVLTVVHNNSYTTGIPAISLGTLASGTYILSGTIGTASSISLYLNGTYNKVLNSGSTFTVDGTQTVELRFGKTDVETYTFTNMMLNSGETALPYEPYYNYELCKIGDYQDKIYKENDKWYIEKNVGKVVLNGSESWDYGGVSNIFYTTSITDYAITNNIPVSNYYTGVTNVTGASGMGSQENNTISFINRSGETTPRFYIKDIRYDNSSSLKTWLNTHNLSVYYVLDTSTTTEITSGTTLYSQLEALGNVTVTSSTVMISNDSEIPFEIKIEYYGR